MRLIRTLSRLRRCERGVSIIELGLVMPLLSIMLVGLVDVASCFSAQMTIQQAAARSLERVQTSGSTTDFAYVRTEAAAAAGVAESQVTLDSWLECDNVRQAATVVTCTSTQISAKYLQVSISSTYTPYFPFSPLGTRQADGKVGLSAASAVRYG
jgi:Flp pilus assembly protein TadG